MVVGLMAITAAAPVSAQAPDQSATPAHSTDNRVGSATTVTFKVAQCSGCRIRLYQGQTDPSATWQSKARRVRTGKVTFHVPSGRTHGISASIDAPWEGTTGFVSMVAFRYRGESVGSRVSNGDARAKHRASGCWAGTDRDGITIPLRVRRVTVPGTTGPATAARAWTGTTQDWSRPMERAYRGVLGTQEVLARAEG